MKDQFDSESSQPKGEELPIEELNGIMDWNASAWERMQNRDKESSQKKQEILAGHLSAIPMSVLDSSFAVLNRTNQDTELRDAIAKEIERRIDAGDSGAVQ